jgi:hypothetical protein
MCAPRAKHANRRFIRGCWLLCWVVIAPGAGPSACRADVVVLANRTPDRVRFTVSDDRGPQSGLSYALAVGDVLPVFVEGKAYAQLAGNKDTYELLPNCAYFFAADVSGTDLHVIDLGGDPTTLTGRPVPHVPQAGSDVIPVKLYVDDDQMFTRQVWEPRLRRRLALASRILRKHSGIGFRVVGCELWDSDDNVQDFTQSLLEFVREVDPGNALAIGFTSQYPTREGPAKLGGTRLPLDRHILIREWSRRISEAERLEVLVHELGHHLGASHSLEADSVMRPVLGDRIARDRSFQIKFDPVNTLAMSLIGEEIRSRGARTLDQLSKPTRFRLRQIYAELAMANPRDPVPQKYILLFQ